ncbi:hypothetical protein PMIN06_006180 [Paraphaeosphaeria minitans]|uniref:Uncharacterized protein n=1 Tax=Paraphaeosphaeria minitans TaxID=565426 RepID=A0A9P6GF74_9PLEO|nr:hypothetical protein PMIN01_07575 [Paraphaeosphaeria minitans]
MSQPAIKLQFADSESTSRPASSSEPPATDYIAKVLEEASNDDLTQSFSNLQTAPPKIAYFGSSPYTEHSFISPSSTRDTLQIDELFRKAEADRDNAAICIIENISPAYIGILGPAWNISASFFANHSKHTNKDHFWGRPIRWSWEPNDEDPRVMSYPTHIHLDGMFEYHHLDIIHQAERLGYFPNTFPRDCFKEGKYPVQSNTRISYCRVHPKLYLFLVDAPLAWTHGLRSTDNDLRTTLRLQYSRSRGGILLPQLFNRDHYSLFESLRTVFQHGWHSSLLFEDIKGVLPGHPMLYMISSSLWETNLGFLTATIRNISFRDLRNPSDSTNDKLHDQRQDLDYLRTFVMETLKWHPSTLPSYFLSLHKYNERHRSNIADNSEHPLQNLTRILEDAEKLQRFLIDTFQLLMSSISVRESRLSIEQARLSAEQARRSAWLTQLASVYLPLSVVTGIFGMNLKEISDRPPRWWWAAVVLVVLVVCTMGVYYSLKEVGTIAQGIRQKREEGQQEKQAREKIREKGVGV